MAQNIFDNEKFYEGYKKIRRNPDNANVQEEKPALYSLLPNLEGLSVLDLGCGFGENCKIFSERGAAEVTGIDISKKMLYVAKEENKTHNITYLNMSIEEVEKLNQKFDIIISSLALHYVEDFHKLAKTIFSMLNKGGVFIFSQEHPLTTAPKEGTQWIKDENGNVDHYCLKDYGTSGERRVEWLILNVIKYHRTFADIFNTLIAAGFNIDKVLEPIPSEELMNRVPKYEKNLHKPNFLLIRATKE